MKENHYKILTILMSGIVGIILAIFGIHGCMNIDDVLDTPLPCLQLVAAVYLISLTIKDIKHYKK